MMNLKQLYDAKQKYYEAERAYGQYIYSFMRDYYNSNHTEPLPKCIGARVEFQEYGKYSNPELIISSTNELLTSDMLDILCEEFQLKVTNKCIRTNVNESTGEINTHCRVYFSHEWGDEHPIQREKVDVLNNIIINYGADLTE